MKSLNSLILFLFIFCAVPFAAAQDGDFEGPVGQTIPAPKEYPKEAMAAGYGGAVKVTVKVDREGNVSGIESVSGPDSVCPGVTHPAILALRNSAAEAAKLAKFSPATRSGKPVESSIAIDYKFGDLSPDWPFDGKGKYVAGDKDTSLLPQRISGGIVNGRAIKLPKPAFPPAARAVRASGAVNVRVLIDEEGKVFAASSVSGHPLLRAASEKAACGAEFSPLHQPVRITGIITYNFVP